MTSGAGIGEHVIGVLPRGRRPTRLMSWPARAAHGQVVRAIGGPARAFVIPVGLLVDRSRRIPLLAASIVLWSVASLLSTVAGSFGQLAGALFGRGVLSPSELDRLVVRI